MSWRPAIRFLLSVSIAIALLSISGASAGNTTMKAAQANSCFLPIVRVDWTPPCGGVPFLISPPDGNENQYNIDVVVDGGYLGGEKDYLEIEFSRTSDFKDSTGRFFPHAGRRLEYPIWIFQLEEGRWYWRASVWCKGRGWPYEPPDGYVQSPFSQVWSFTLTDYPYVPP